MQGLKKQLQDNQLHNIYLFYGEEHYLLDFYLDKTINSALSTGDKTMNYDYFDGSRLDIEKVADTIETLPFFADKRVIVIKYSKLFKSGKKSDSEKMAEKLKSVPDTSVILFVEEEIDKRNKLYKTIKNSGYIVEFNRLSENDLIKWIGKKLHASGKKIERSTAEFFIKNVGLDMAAISNELEKLIMYNYDNEIITKESVMTISTRTIENKIFELVNAMGQKRRDRAIMLYHDLLILKEPPARVLFMLTRQFRLVLQALLLSKKGMDANMSSKKMKTAPFIVKECLKQSKNYNPKILEEALEDCLITDTKIKSGKLDPKIGVEIIIMKYSG